MIAHTELQVKASEGYLNKGISSKNAIKVLMIRKRQAKNL